MFARLSILGLAAAWVLAAGCFDPDPLEGAQCTADDRCPEGQSCAADKRCYVTAPPIRLRKRIDLHPSTPNQLNNFTVGIILAADGDLAENAAADASDLAFTLADGVTPLDFEIESYDGSSGGLVAWVRINELVQGTPIFMYYGGDELPPARDPSAAWGQNSLGVWHFSDDGSGLYADSSGNGRNGEAALSVRPSSAVGLAGGALSFDGIDDVINVLGESLFNGDFLGEGQASISFWFKRIDPPSGALLTLQAGAVRVELGRNQGEWAAIATPTDPTLQTSTSFGPDRPDEWALLTLTVADFGQLFVETRVNGARVASASTPCGGGGQACFPSPTARFGPVLGIVDEVRASLQLGEIELTAHFENLTDPASFFTVGPQEAATF